MGKLVNMTKIVAFAMALFCFFACGQVGQESTLELSAQMTSVTVGTKVTFKVMNDGVQDVSGMARIKSVKTGRYLESNTWVAEDAGTWSFVAEFEGVTSNSIDIVVVEPVVSKFRKHICLMEFTGQWCSMCPDGATTINYYATKVYPDIMHVLAFHNEDDFTIPQEQVLFKQFNPGAYPGYILDMKSAGIVSNSKFSQDMKDADSQKGLHCGVAVSSSISADKANVKVSVFSEMESQYRIAAYVIEDKVVARQNVNGNYREDYVHRHVVRKMISASVEGDDLGVIAADKEKTKEYSVDLDPAWNKANLEVCVLVIGNDLSVNNTAACALDGGKADYDRL